jgi:hypothetical protein
MLDIFPEREDIEIYSALYFCASCSVSGPLVCEDYSNKSATDATI